MVYDFIFFKGNKGAVSVRLSIYGCSVCFVNAHLSAHDNQLKDRIEDYNAILSDQEFHVAEHKEIFFHEYVHFLFKCVDFFINLIVVMYFGWVTSIFD